MAFKIVYICVLNYMKSICKEGKETHFQILSRIRIIGNFNFLLHTFCYK